VVCGEDLEKGENGNTKTTGGVETFTTEIRTILGVSIEEVMKRTEGV